MRLRRRREHGTPAQPIVVANDWTTLTVPSIEEWKPTKSVSVVIPAYRPRNLDLVLAALAAQSYPDHLLEVVVVDDASQPPLILPEVRPTNTLLARTADGWGPGAARITGVERSEGEVLHWLDADMIPRRAAVEAHLRWHHAIDYAVVVGERVFADLDALDHIKPGQLRSALISGAMPEDLCRGGVRPTAWTSSILEQTDRLATAGPRGMRMHVSASSSVNRDLYRESGGFPRGVRFGEDTILGYRLREAGAVFIPDAEAVSVHPGDSRVERNRDQVNRYAKPFITDHVPEFRGHRLQVHRSYQVPYAEVVVPAVGASFEDTALVVNSQLVSTVPDLVVTILGPWPSLSAGRRHVLDEPEADLHLLQAAFSAEARVRLTDEQLAVSEATFRLHLPSATRFPTGDALGNLLHRMEVEHLGLVRIATEAGTIRIERTAAVARARRIGADCLIEHVYPSIDIPLAASGFVTAEQAPRIGQVNGLVGWGT